jgi:HAD superfamily hydrolase (TIGR01509 family)
MNQMQAVIFDLDGLMIDSEPLSKKAWIALLAKYDQELTDDEFAATIGLHSIDSATFLKDLKGLEEEVEVLVEKCDSLRLEIIRAEAEPVEGLEDLIEHLMGKGLKIGVASNSPGNYVEAALETIHLRDLFPCVVAVDDVEHGKPAPDLYLEAARCLSVEPRLCLTIEDSPSGMKAAIAAGMRCVVVPNQDLRSEEFPGAFARFGSILELSEVIDNLLIIDGGIEE